MRRYLQGGKAGGETSGFINRDTAKETGGQNSAPKGNKYTFFMTITDDKGRPVRGPSKRKGREGQFELYSLMLANNAGHAAPRPGRGNVGPSREVKQEGDTTTITTNEVVSFSFMKRIDDASPLLMQMLSSGQHVVMHFEMVATDADGKETVVLTADMKDVLLTGYQPAGNDTDKDKTPLESVGAETEGMVTVLRAMAEKAAEGGQKVTTIDLGKQL